MTVKFLKPVRVGDKLSFVGRVTRSKGRVFLTEGAVSDEAGDIYASATGKYIEAKEGLRRDLMKSLD